MNIGFACGVFDLFHIGHVMMLKECRENCDFLIVALNKSDNFSNEINPGKSKPIFSIEERIEIVKSCRFVDEVVVYNSEEELYELLKTKNITIRFLGDDYRNRKITGEDLNIPLYYINREHGFSTSKILNKIIQKYKDEKNN